MMNDLDQFVELSLISNFHNKKCVVFNLTSFGSLKYDCVIKTIEMFSFLSLINNSVTMGLIFYY